MLNTKQMEAVVNNEGAVMVIAGAGSGKTMTLVEKISFLIEKKGAKPNKILGITFTNKAASEMRERLSVKVGNSAKDINMSTFHSWCARNIREIIPYLDKTYNKYFGIADTDQTVSVLKSEINRWGFDIKKFPHKELYSAIGLAKNNAVYMTDLKDEKEIKQSFLEYIKSHKFEDFDKNKIFEIFKGYQKQLEKNNLMDFEDLIINFIEILEKNSTIRGYYQEKYDYILVDEYQDTNVLQYKMIKILTEKNKNIFVVGDGDQSIYKWRGANPKNITDFVAEYNPKIIKLEQNYRSTSNILKAANNLIKNNGNRIDKKLFTENSPGQNVKLRVYDDGREEAREIVYKIKKSVDNGRKYADNAILYRVNFLSRSIEQELIKNHIPYKIYGGLTFFQRKEVKDVLSYFRLILSDVDDIAFCRVMALEKGVGKTTIDKLRIFSEKNNQSMKQMLLSEEIHKKFKGVTKTKMLKFRTKIEKMSFEMDDEDGVRQSLEKFLDMTGYIQKLIEDDEEEERYENVRELINALIEIHKQNKHNEEYINYQTKEKIAFLTNELYLSFTNASEEADADGVSLMTIHASKGLEFPLVYLPAMEETIFPKEVDSTEELEEDRRCAYVALTRAKEELYISRAKMRYMYGRPVFNEPSPFLEEIK